MSRLDRLNLALEGMTREQQEMVLNVLVGWVSTYVPDLNWDEGLEEAVKAATK